MTDIPTAPEPTLADLKADADFHQRWNNGDPAAIRQLEAATRAAVIGAPVEKPRPVESGTGLLTPAQARQLAQASVDAGQDPATIKAALAADGIEFEPDTRDKATRAWDDDFAVNRPERYRLDDMDRRFVGDHPQEVEALAGVTRAFVAQLGFDRSGGSELAGEITKAVAELRGQRPEVRSAYEQRQAAMLGSHRDQLVKDAASALAGVDPKLVEFMRQGGALSSANVVMALAHMAQARAVRGGVQ